MKKHTLKVRDVDRKIFEQMRDGIKKVETRAATPKHRKTEKGDVLVIVCGNDKTEKEIKKVSIFKTISELLKVYKIKDISPLSSTREDLEKMWYSFPNYREKIKQHGLIAFEI